jgi:poly(U)-specific endoribonuclease
VTISYRWHAPDYDRKALRPLTKKIGGFFVGCSVEGLLALGSVRAHLGARAPKEAIINGARSNLKVFHSPNNRHIRTFYPVFMGAVDTGNNGNSGGGGNGTGNGDGVTPVVAGHIRIVAALVNPEGHDPGGETVTVINTGTAQATLNGWQLKDKNGRSQRLANVSIDAGETVRLVLDPSGAQLSNKGGRISLLDPNGNAVHTVSYSKGQAKANGETLLF